MLVVASVTEGPLDLRLEGAGQAGALQDMSSCVRRGSQLRSVRGLAVRRGRGLTLAGDVGADAAFTLLPQATVAPGEADPVVGGSGENREDIGQEAQQDAPALKAPLHPHAREAAAGAGAEEGCGAHRLYWPTSLPPPKPLSPFLQVRKTHVAPRPSAPA